MLLSEVRVVNCEISSVFTLPVIFNLWLKASWDLSFPWPCISLECVAVGKCNVKCSAGNDRQLKHANDIIIVSSAGLSTP